MADQAHSGKALEADDTGRLWQRLAGRRYVAWGVFFFGSLLLAPDPTGLLPIVTALGLIVLFEGVVRVLRWRGR